MISYDKLRANLLQSSDYSRPNRFSVEFNPPNIDSINNVFNGSPIDRLSLNCISGNLPGRTLETSESSYSGGYKHKKAIDTTFSDLECSFYLSEDLLEKQIFDSWQSYIFDPNFQVSTYPDDYYRDIIIVKESKGRNDPSIGQYVFVNAFPNNVQDVIQSYESESVVDILPVTFSYHRWYFIGNGGVNNVSNNLSNTTEIRQADIRETPTRLLRSPTRV